jgi:hypothetical protein
VHAVLELVGGDDAISLAVVMANLSCADYSRVRLRFVLLIPFAAALAANVVAYAAWRVADGAEDFQYFLPRIGALAALLTGLTVAFRARARLDEAISAAAFSAMFTFVLTWIPLVIVVLLYPPV